MLLQNVGGAYVADFSGYPDEPAHYVTGLMAHDYLATFPWGAPLPFARRFYAYYPMLGIGHWPPLFYLTQALWTLLAGTSKASILLLMAGLAASTATILFRHWRMRFGTVTSGFLALAFLATPVVQELSRMVMAEMLLAMFLMLAVLAYHRYLVRPQLREATYFGLFSAAAILTKPNGLALALLPMFSMAVTRRVDLMKRASFWLPALIVAVLCGPWYLLTADMAREGWSASYDASWLLRHPVTENAAYLFAAAGMPVFLLAVFGILYVLWPGSPNSVATDHAVMIALLASIVVFHSLVAPVREARHLIPAVPVLLSFSAVAVAAIAGRIGVSTRRQPWLVSGFAAVTAAGLLLMGARTPQKLRTGVDLAVHHILARPHASESVLVSSEAAGEGIFIAELAGRERRPGHRVLRASKVLSTSNWDGSRYRPVYRTAEDVGEYLAAADIRIVVVDVSTGANGSSLLHHQQLVGALRGSGGWRKLESDSLNARFQVFESTAGH